MANDPPASDLEAIRAHVTQYLPAHMLMTLPRDALAVAIQERQDAVIALLAAYDAQAARLAAHQAVLERLRDRAHFSSDPYSRDYAEWIDAEMATLGG